ncbi:MAG TPA: glycosyltransferase family 87 protein [Acidobacteriaceae bacterium]|nr:glycosyltransferase family 87 protein [Acidobacteriaceae bacterium]
MFNRCRKLLLNGFTAQIVVVLAFLAVFVYLALRDYPRHDFVCYWSSSQLLAAGHNPYDPSAIRQIERALGFAEQGPAFIMRNPPLMLPLVAPLACFPLKVAILLWAGLMLTLGSLACWMLTRNCPDKRDLLIYFAPLLICLWNGQSTTIVLFAVAFFFCFSRKRPVASGVLLSLTSIKPHLLLLFWPVLALDCIRRRDWKVPAGVLAGTAALAAVSFCLDPHAWAQYRLAMNQQGIGTQFLANVSAELRFLLFPRLPWVQFIPFLVGLVAALVWYARRPDWKWSTQGALLIGLSAVLSPYSWTYDLALVLPAVLTLPATEKVRQCVILASLMTLLPLEWTRVWASPAMSFAGVFWVGWYCLARFRFSQPAPACDPALG